MGVQNNRLPTVFSKIRTDILQCSGRIPQKMLMTSENKDGTVVGVIAQCTKFGEIDRGIIDLGLVLQQLGG